MDDSKKSTPTLRDSETTMKKERKRSESAPRPTISQYVANVALNKEARSLKLAIHQEECSRMIEVSLQLTQEPTEHKPRRFTKINP